MPATVEILTIPIGSQLTSIIQSGESANKNDFTVLLIFSQNVTGLTLADLSVSAGSLVSLTGKNAVYAVRVRPPTTSTVLTFTVAANAVTEGNSATSQNIRVSRSFPDADAEVPTQLFSVNLSDAYSLAVSSTRVFIAESTANRIYKYLFDGTEQVSEAILSGNRAITYFNDSLLEGQSIFYQLGRRINAVDGTLLQTFPFTNLHSVVPTRFGFLNPASNTVWKILPYGETESDDLIDIHLNVSIRAKHVTSQGDLLYLLNTGSPGEFSLAHITDDEDIAFIQDLNIQEGTGFFGDIKDIAVYEDKLYILQDNGSTGAVYTVDIRKYRPLRKNTKTTIPVQFATVGDKIDLTQFSPDAEKFTFAVGFDKPSYLSINANNELVVGSGGDVALVKLTAINRIDSIALEFYLVIRQAAAPIWTDVSELTMRAGSTYNLFQIVPDAETIEFRSGRDRLSGSSLSNGIFTVGTTGGPAHFTAQKGNLSSHIKIQIDVLRKRNTDDVTDASRYRVEIEGIDVTHDLSEFPSVSETLDPVVLNEFRVNGASITLKNDGGTYSDKIAGNFWETNRLNPGGFQNTIKIYTEHLDGTGTWIENLLFTGIINESFEPIRKDTFKLNCVDISSRLRNARVRNFGTLQKWDVFRRQSDEANVEGVYVPERSLLPIQPETVGAWEDRTALTLSRLELPSEGPAPANTAHATRADLRTAGGYLESNPIVRYKTQHRSEDVRFLIHQLALNTEVYNVELDIPEVTVDEPFLLNRGSVALSVEPTRTTRLPVDWVSDAPNDRLLMLLSNPEGHVSDLLVQYNLNADSYRVLHTFSKDLVVHRIERRNSTNYYILTSKPIPQDRSAQTLPRPTDSTSYAYDSAAEGSAIKIYHFNASTNTLTEHVAEDDSFPPQLGIHYWIGFENKLYIDEFEGICSDYRGAFKVVGSDLYYRYANESEFGVARVNTSGTTTKLIGQAIGDAWNHLNFAFDVTTTGTVYFVYVTAEDEYTSTLIIKRRTSGGTETTILEDIQALGEGIYLGAYEALFHNNYLYILVPIGRVDLGADARDTAADPDFIIERADTGKSGERSVTTTTNLNPSNTRLAPGDDIPIRIDFNGSVSGATQSDLTVYGGSIQSFSISSDMIDITIRPNDLSVHKTIVIDLAEDAVDQQNEATRIVVDFETRRSETKSAGMTLYRCNVTANSPSLEVLETYDFVQRGACNLIVHEGAVHFVEHPPAATKFKPINPDL